uniref:ORF101 n=1 Tax=Pinus koraiensis TaxID=88728 RepID=A4QM40_PINKO|nr:ORF101 [Pinus koraiensis]
MSQRSICGKTSRQVVMHNNRNSQFSCKYCPFHHFFTCTCSSIQIMSLNFTRLSLSLINCFRTKDKTVSPAHEWLGIYVLIILGKIESTTETFVNCSTIVFG